MSQTCAILKPDCIEKAVMGKVIERIEAEGFLIQALKMIRLTTPEAEAFYAVHRDKPFYAKLITFMTRGSVVVMVLERADAVDTFRQLIGATDPAEAEAGTIRKQFAENITINIVHGSDSDKNAKREIDFFFSDAELIQTKRT